MPRVLHIKRKLAGAEGRYLDKALSVGGLVGAWMRDEKSGAISYDQSGLGHHGTHVGVTLGQPGVPGMGMTSPFHDGANDYTNIYSAGLANDNRLLNSGFETAGGGDPDFWANYTETAGDGALANEVGIVHQGTDSAKMTSGLTSNTNVFGDAMVSVPGKVDRFRFFTYGDGANAGRYGVYDITNGAYIVPLTSTGITAAAWGAVPVQYTVPVGCISVRIEYWCPPVNGGVCYYDTGEVRSMDGLLGDEGTLLAWPEVSGVGVWTDSTFRVVVDIRGAAGNLVVLRRSNVNGAFSFLRQGGGISETITRAGMSDTDFFPVAITWSELADQFIGFYNGLQEGFTQVGLGAWAGNLVATEVCIGSRNTTPTNLWSGPIGPVLLFNEAKSPAEILYLSTP